MGHEGLQATESGRGVSRRRGFVATERAQRSQLSVDTGTTAIVQPTLCRALGAAEVAAIHVVAVGGITARRLVEDVAFREKRPAVPDASPGSDPDFHVHGFLSFHAASASAGEGRRDHGRALKVTFRALEAELLTAPRSSLLVFDAKAFLAASQLLANRTLAEACKVGLAG
jgi:hypothetical protein